ncbi:energy-coupling factor transporter transmembrane protein EcfT, partial [Enterococcus faecalis]
MSQRQMLGNHPDSTWNHRLNGTSKLVFLIVDSVACMTSYETRYLLGMSVVSLVLLNLSNIKWHHISF